MSPARSESLPSVAETVCTRLALELDGQGAVAQHEGEVLGLALGEVPLIEIWSAS